MVRKNIVKSKWEYEVRKSLGYGYVSTIYKNGERVCTQGSFGSESVAEDYARSYMLEAEFGIT